MYNPQEGDFIEFMGPRSGDMPPVCDMRDLIGVRGRVYYGGGIIDFIPIDQLELPLSQVKLLKAFSYNVRFLGRDIEKLPPPTYIPVVGHWVRKEDGTIGQVVIAKRDEHDVTTCWVRNQSNVGAAEQCDPSTLTKVEQ